MADELLHHGEDAAIQSGRGKHRLVIAEGVFEGFGEVTAREVGDDRLFSPALQLLFEGIRRLLGVAVHAGVGNESALALRLVFAPCVVEGKIGREVAVQHGTVQGADDRDVEPRELFKKRLHLHAVFSDDVEVVSPRLASPVVRLVAKSAEFAESVRREQHLVLAFVAHHDLRPMHHGRGVESELVLAEGEFVPLFDEELIGKFRTVEVPEHVEYLRVADDCHFGIFRRKRRDARRMIGFHVRDDEIVGLSARKSVLDVAEPFRDLRLVHGVHDRDLLVHDDVGVVAHALGHDILPFKEVERGVVNADVNDVLCFFHPLSP